MKKLICLITLFALTLALCVPVTAADTEAPTYTPTETFTREELLAMDPELDSDGDGLADVYEITFGTNRFNADTDYDGVNDYVELCVTCTNVLIPDGDIDTDGDGMTNAQEAIYGTNPDDLDTDNDNLGDYKEIFELATDPLVKDNTAEELVANVQSSFSPVNSSTGASTFAIGPEISLENPGGTSALSSSLVTSYDNGNSYNCSSITYTMNTNWFFFDNTEYNSQLAIISSILSALAYDSNYLSTINGGTIATTAANAVYDWMDYHSFAHPDKSYDLDYNATTNPSGYTDQHVSEMFIGHKSATFGGSTKNIICVVIRGTNGTLDEWQSNFDVGSTDDYSSVSSWKDMTNHMGFDITARRLNTKLNSYISANGLSGEDNVLWITGHSRGGALANILAAIRVNAGNEVFAYTFASPATTTASTANVSASYDCIFNIINEDDLVPQLPLESWNFKRYGQDLSASIEDSYASQWDSLMGGELTYTSNQTLMNTTVDKFEGIADNRNQCYEYKTGINAYYVDSLYPTYESAQLAVNGIIAEYPVNTAGTYYWVPTGSAQFYGYAMYQKPAFFMQLLAAQMSNTITKEQFVTIKVAPYLDSAKIAIIQLAALNYDPSTSTFFNNFTMHPHYTESYYLLATKLL